MRIGNPKCPKCNYDNPCNEHSEVPTWTPPFAENRLQPMMRMHLEDLAKTIVTLPEKDRVFLWECMKTANKFCLKCGEDTNGSTCWGCYDSRPGD